MLDHFPEAAFTAAGAKWQQMFAGVNPGKETALNLLAAEIRLSSQTACMNQHGKVTVTFQQVKTMAAEIELTIPQGITKSCVEFNFQTGEVLWKVSPTAAKGEALYQHSSEDV